jgi:hypothetical protein
MQTPDAMHIEAHARGVCAPAHARGVCAPTTALRREAVGARAIVFQPLLADVCALSRPTQQVHWSMCGRHVRAYPLLLAEQGAPLFVMTDAPAERARAIGVPRCPPSVRSHDTNAGRTTRTPTSRRRPWWQRALRTTSS